jgi:hypothetical protein
LKKFNPITHKPRKQEKIGIFLNNKTLSPTSIRLSGDDRENLQKIVRAVNEVSRSQISTTKVVRALLQIGTTLEPRDILDALVVTL